MNAVIEKVNVNAHRPIGAILIGSGRLKPEAAETVVRLQNAERIRFGDAAIRLGLLTEDDVRQALSLQYDYRYLAPDDDAVDPEVVTAFRPFGRVAEQMRALRAQLVNNWLESHERNVFAVVSPAAGEGRSFIAANLAVVFAQQGHRVLLLDADLRRPRQQALFRLPDKIGLSSVLAGRAEPDDAILRIGGLANLSVLPAGPVPPNPLELFNRASFGRLMAALRDQFDVVIADTASGLTADAQAVTLHAGAALIVARKDVTPMQGLQNFVDTLRHGGTEVLGALLNNG